MEHRLAHRASLAAHAVKAGDEPIKLAAVAAVHFAIAKSDDRRAPHFWRLAGHFFKDLECNYCTVTLFTADAVKKILDACIIFRSLPPCHNGELMISEFRRK